MKSSIDLVELMRSCAQKKQNPKGEIQHQQRAEDGAEVRNQRAEGRGQKPTENGDCGGSEPAVSTAVAGTETRGQDARATIGRSQTAATEEIRAVAQEMEGWREAAGGSIVELLAEWVAGVYLLATKKQLAGLCEGPERVKLLHQAAGDVAALQRGGRFAARLKLDREKLEFERQKHTEMLAATEKKMREQPDYFRPLTDAERLAIVDKVDEVMGLK